MPQSMMESTLTTFYGIFPGRKAYLIGKVILPVTFGTPANFRTERLVFELVNFNSPYHCVLGRQVFINFMVAPYYAYNMMKLPGPCGIIIVHDDPNMSRGNSPSTNTTLTPKRDLSSSFYVPSMKRAAKQSPKKCSDYSLQALSVQPS